MRAALALTIASLLLAAPTGAEIQRNLQPLADEIVNSVQQKLPRPVISANRSISTQQAYQLQQRMVELLYGELAFDGFKAGLTTPAAQRKFGTSAPVAGVLPAASRLRARGRELTVARADFIRPMFEVELGFRLRRPLSAPVESIDALRALVAGVVPVIELPDLAFTDLGAVTAIDLIANNVLASQWITGVEIGHPGTVAINGIGVAVYRDGEEVMRGLAGKVMDDQWRALLWLVNHTVSQGYVIAPDQLCITGAMSGMAPLLAGQYVADFGSLGVVRFTVR